MATKKRKFAKTQLAFKEAFFQAAHITCDMGEDEFLRREMTWPAFKKLNVDWLEDYFAERIEALRRMKP